MPVPPPQSSPLAVLVTGASRGLGYELVVQYARASPANVVFAGVRDPSSEGARALTGLGLKNVHVVELDVAREDSVRASVGAVQRIVDRLDVLVNNAGIYGSAEGMDPTTATSEQFSTVFTTNVAGVLLTTQAYLPLIRRSSSEAGAKVINMSSGMGSNQLVNVRWARPSTSYGTSKGRPQLPHQRLQVCGPRHRLLAIHPDGWPQTWARQGVVCLRRGRPDSVLAIRYYIATKTVKNSGEFLDVPSGQLIRTERQRSRESTGLPMRCCRNEFL